MRKQSPFWVAASVVVSTVAMAQDKPPSELARSRRTGCQQCIPIRNNGSSTEIWGSISREDRWPLRRSLFL